MARSQHRPHLAGNIIHIQPVWSGSVDDVKGCVDLSEEPIKTQDFYGALKAPTFKPKSFRNLSKHLPYLSFIIIYAFQL